MGLPTRLRRRNCTSADSTENPSFSASETVMEQFRYKPAANSGRSFLRPCHSAQHTFCRGESEEGKNTRCAVRTVVADHKYGTNENYVACQARGITTHMGEAARNRANTGRKQGIFSDEAFTFDPVQNIYRCPAGQILKPRRIHPLRRTLEYKAPARACAVCALHAQCTRSHHGRTA